tara:strand:- start:346 stop:564 length:219 start_codon:yes stop_codon:yes gene_type:complete
MSKKIFEVDINSFEELQDLIIEYFEIFSLLLSRENIRIKSIKIDADSNKVLVETEEAEDDSEEDTEWDFEWV